MTKRILILRFSALGDIALLIPVVQALQRSYPQHSITVASQPFVASLFSPLSVNFYPVKLQNYAGLMGLWRLSKELHKNIEPEVVLDMHNVLRTQLIRQYFRLKGAQVAVIHKRRAQKRQMTRKRGKIRKLLPHVTEGYAQVCRQAGYNLQYNPHDAPPTIPYQSMEAERLFAKHKAAINVGIAPTARHRAKEWPLQKWIQLLKHRENEAIHWWLMGGGGEKTLLEHLLAQSQQKGTVVAGKLKLHEEVALLGKLDAVIALDSSNMHLATLAGVPVVSIWGATHPHLGFRPLGANNQKYMVQLAPAELSCRPCSTFGQKPCWRGDYACLQNLPEERVHRALWRIIAEGS